MNRVIRILLILVGTLVFITLIASIALRVVLRRSFPQTNGTVTLTGLQAEVDVYRDQYGVPHIYAQNEADLFFAQGYVHAQDRFWQMEFWRHISTGRLSQIIGEVGVENDKFIRTAGWNRLAIEVIESYKTESPEIMAMLEAYSAGVNAYLADQGDNISFSYTIMGQVAEKWEIEPWEPYHSVAWGIVLAEDLSSGHRRDELARARFSQQNIDETTINTLHPFYPYDNRPVSAPSNDLVPAGSMTLNKATNPSLIAEYTFSTDLIGVIPDTGFIFGQGEGIGSNNWVVSGEYTESGLPLLANDPHLGLQMPAIWYEVGLHAPGWDVRGFSLASVPGIIIGHNNRIAWALTNVNPDIVDLYIEKINPDNPNQYEFMGEWRDMEVIEEVIKVNGGEDVILPVRITHHGPIITEVIDDIDNVLAMRWTAKIPSAQLKPSTYITKPKTLKSFGRGYNSLTCPHKTSSMPM